MQCFCCLCGLMYFQYVVGQRRFWSVLVSACVYATRIVGVMPEPCVNVRVLRGKWALGSEDTVCFYVFCHGLLRSFALLHSEAGRV